MQKDKKALSHFQIQPLNDDVLANLSIEELEERLEMQILHLNEAQWCVIEICGCNESYCRPDSPPPCPEDGTEIGCPNNSA